MGRIYYEEISKFDKGLIMSCDLDGQNRTLIYDCKSSGKIEASIGYIYIEGSMLYFSLDCEEGKNMQEKTFLYRLNLENQEVEELVSDVSSSGRIRENGVKSEKLGSWRY